MFRVAFLAVLAAATNPQDDKAPDLVHKELGKLQGSWTTATVTYNGKEYFGEGKPGLRFIFKGDTADVEGNDRVKKEYAKLRFKLNPDSKPALVDLTVTLGVQAEAIMEGIYELKDDELKICVKVFGIDRPTAFAAPAGSSTALVVLKRDKK